jgi:uncharacterized membrane protein
MATSVSTPEVFPQNRVEFVNAFAHYYRAEIQRAISWRDRLDRTTNWAITVAAGILSVSLNQPEKHHGLLLFAMALVFLMLAIESRRYRFFDVYRRRVRMFETGYYGHIMALSNGRTGHPGEQEWLAQLGDNIRAPQVTLTLMEAMAHRLRRNYCWIFLILLAAWLLKVEGSLAFTQILTRPSDLHLQAEIGWTPGWAVLVLVLGFHAWLVYIMIRYGGATREPVMREV